LKVAFNLRHQQIAIRSGRIFFIVLSRICSNLQKRTQRAGLPHIIDSQNRRKLL